MKLIVRIVIILCLALVVYAHVWQRVQVLRLGYTMSELERKNEELIRESRALTLELSRLASIGRIEDLSETEFTGQGKVIELVSSGQGDSCGKKDRE